MLWRPYIMTQQSWLWPHLTRCLLRLCTETALQIRWPHLWAKQSACNHVLSTKQKSAALHGIQGPRSLQALVLLAESASPYSNSTGLRSVGLAHVGQGLDPECKAPLVPHVALAPVMLSRVHTDLCIVGAQKLALSAYMTLMTKRVQSAWHEDCGLPTGAI